MYHAAEAGGSAPGEFACTPLGVLPPELWLEAADVAREFNPTNDVARHASGLLMRQLAELRPEHLAVLTQKKFAAGSVLPVKFLDDPDRATRTLILTMANRWYDRGANVRFEETASDDAVVRVARLPGQGYWSYIGTDCVMMARKGRQTMNLQGFTSRTPHAELVRVAPHEFGHACGFPHGQQTPAIVARIDVEKAVRYYMATQGWDYAQAAMQFEALASSQVQLFGADDTSIMEYPVPSFLLRPGARPVPGGVDVTPDDAKAAALFYPGKGGPMARVSA